MNARLNREDAAALDLLLDHSPAASGHAAPVYVPSHAQDRQRVQCAQRVLGLLQLMPVGDPPLDLLAKTLNHIGQSANVHVGASPLLAHAAQPHA